MEVWNEDIAETVAIRQQEGRYFDTVACCNVLDRTPKPVCMLRAVHGLLKPQGFPLMCMSLHDNAPCNYVLTPLRLVATFESVAIQSRVSRWASMAKGSRGHASSRHHKLAVTDLAWQVLLEPRAASSKDRYATSAAYPYPHWEDPHFIDCYEFLLNSIRVRLIVPSIKT